MKKLYTTTEAAKIIGYSKDSLRVLIKRGKLTAFKMGKTWIICESDLRRFIDKHTKPA